MITRRRFLASSAIAAASALALRQPIFASSQSQAEPSAQPEQQTLLQSLRAAASSASIQSTKLTDTLYMLSNVGANIVVFVGPDGKLILDSGIATGAPRLLDALTKLDPHPPRLLVNTSWLFDHTDGNAALHAAGAFIIGQENIRQRLIAPQRIAMFNLDLPASPASALPQQTFVNIEKLYFNNDEVDLTHAPNASTDTDTYVHFVNANVIHAGELWVNRGYPVIDPGSEGTINGLIQGVDRVLELADDRTQIVPSHGQAGNKSAMAAYREMLTTVANRVERLKITGQSLDQVLAAKVTADLDSEWSHGEISPSMFLTSVYNTL